MRNISRHHPEIHLPLLAWSERHRSKPLTKQLTGYRVTAGLNVQPIWCEVPHG